MCMGGDSRATSVAQVSLLPIILCAAATRKHSRPLSVQVWVSGFACRRCAGGIELFTINLRQVYKMTGGTVEISSELLGDVYVYGRGRQVTQVRPQYPPHVPLAFPLPFAPAWLNSVRRRCDACTPVTYPGRCGRRKLFADGARAAQNLPTEGTHNPHPFSPSSGRRLGFYGHAGPSRCEASTPVPYLCPCGGSGFAC